MLNVNIGTTVKGAVDDLDKVWGVVGAWKGGRGTAEGGGRVWGSGLRQGRGG